MRRLLLLVLIASFVSASFVDAAGRRRPRTRRGEQTIRWEQEHLVGLRTFGLDEIVPSPVRFLKSKMRTESLWFMFRDGSRFSGVVQRVGEKQYIFVPYPGFAWDNVGGAENVLRMTQKDEVVTAVATKRLYLYDPDVGGYVKDIEQTIQYSLRDHIFVGDDIVRVEAGGAEYFPAYEHKGHMKPITECLVGLYKREADTWSFVAIDDPNRFGVITGWQLRDQVLRLQCSDRSVAFDIQTEKFTETTDTKVTSK